MPKSRAFSWCAPSVLRLPPIASGLYMQYLLQNFSTQVAYISCMFLIFTDDAQKERPSGADIVSSCPASVSPFISTILPLHPRILTLSIRFDLSVFAISFRFPQFVLISLTHETSWWRSLELETLLFACFPRRELLCYRNLVANMLHIWGHFSWHDNKWTAI